MNRATRKIDTSEEIKPSLVPPILAAILSAATLALAPLVERGLIKREGIVVDAKSGVSGAGRGLSASTHFPEVAETVDIVPFDFRRVESTDLQPEDWHELVDKIQAAAGVDFIIINPAAFTHTSVAIRDALASIAVPFIEIPLSNVHARESFRHKSYFSDLAVGVITGLGPIGYSLALKAAIDLIQTSKG